MSNEYETLRWPTNLDRSGIVLRLVQIREAAKSSGATDFAARFEDVETMSSGQIGICVVTAMTWLQGKPEYASIATQLEMVAMNLKNLK